MRSQNKECLDATCKALEVEFLAIWEANIFLIRLDSVTMVPCVEC